MMTVFAFEAPPPGAGVTTVTEWSLSVLASVAERSNVSFEASENWVVRLLPFHCTVELGSAGVEAVCVGTKFDPLAVRWVTAPGLNASVVTLLRAGSG